MGLGRLEPEAALAAGDDRGLAAGQPEINYRPHTYQAPIKQPDRSELDGQRHERDGLPSGAKPKRKQWLESDRGPRSGHHGLLRHGSECRDSLLLLGTGQRTGGLQRLLEYGDAASTSSSLGGHGNGNITQSD